MTYKVIIEHMESSWGAYVPYLPGCAAIAGTREDLERLIRESIDLHVELRRKRGESIPAVTSIALLDR